MINLNKFFDKDEENVVKNKKRKNKVIEEYFGEMNVVPAILQINAKTKIGLYQHHQNKLINYPTFKNGNQHYFSLGMGTIDITQIYPKYKKIIPEVDYIKNKEKREEFSSVLYNDTVPQNILQEINKKTWKLDHKIEKYTLTNANNKNFFSSKNHYLDERVRAQSISVVIQYDFDEPYLRQFIETNTRNQRRIFEFWVTACYLKSKVGGVAELDRKGYPHQISLPNKRGEGEGEKAYLERFKKVEIFNFHKAGDGAVIPVSFCFAIRIRIAHLKQEEDTANSLENTGELIQEKEEAYVNDFQMVSRDELGNPRPAKDVSWAAKKINIGSITVKNIEMYQQQDYGRFTNEKARYYHGLNILGVTTNNEIEALTCQIKRKIVTLSKNPDIAIKNSNNRHYHINYSPEYSNSISFVILHILYVQFAFTKEQLDLKTFYQFHNDCEEAGYSFNAKIDKQKILWNVLNEIARCGRGFLTKNKGYIQIFGDFKLNTVDPNILSTNDSQEKSFYLKVKNTKEFHKRFVIISYYNKENVKKRVIIGFSNLKTTRILDYINENDKDLIIKKIEYFGCNNYEQAVKHGEYILKKSYYNNISIYMTVNHYENRPEVFDTVAVSNPEFGFGDHVNTVDSYKYGNAPNSFLKQFEIVLDNNLNLREHTAYKVSFKANRKSVLNVPFDKVGARKIIIRERIGDEYWNRLRESIFPGVLRSHRIDAIFCRHTEPLPFGKIVDVAYDSFTFTSKIKIELTSDEVYK